MADKVEYYDTWESYQDRCAELDGDAIRYETDNYTSKEHRYTVRIIKQG